MSCPNIEGFTGLKQYNNFQKKDDTTQWKINDLLQNSALLNDLGIKTDKTFKNLEYNSKYNGLVNVMTDEMDLLSERFSMQDKIPVEESSDFREALNGTMENSMLSKVFFCKENILWCPLIGEIQPKDPGNEQISMSRCDEIFLFFSNSK